MGINGVYYARATLSGKEMSRLEVRGRGEARMQPERMGVPGSANENAMNDRFSQPDRLKPACRH